MLPNAGAACRLLVFSLAVAEGALGQSCNGFNITSDESAEAARRCPEINGDVLIYPDNITDVNLDGVENIHGSLSLFIGCDWWWTDTDYGCTQKQWLRSVSSSTLKTIDGSILMTHNGNISNLSFPKLASVGDRFNLELENLESLDITRLETIGSLYLNTPKLTAMKHENLRNVTGGRFAASGGQLVIRGTGLESVDSFIRSPMDLDTLYIANSLKLKQITVGISKAQSVRIGGVYSWYSQGGKKEDDGESGTARLVLGGPDTTEMRIDRLRIMNSTATIERSPGLVNLEVENLEFDGNYFMEHLALPFDKLHVASLNRAPALKWLSNVPQAVGWEEFMLYIADMPVLNLSSEYMIDDKGDLVRSWYWPQSSLKKVAIYANVTNHFFDTFPMRTGDHGTLDVYNYGAFGNLDCDALEEEKALRHSFRCANMNDEKSLSTRQAPTGAWSLVALCWSAVLWMSYF